jgi:hypothetical protein
VPETAPVAFLLLRVTKAIFITKVCAVNLREAGGQGKPDRTVSLACILVSTCHYYCIQLLFKFGVNFFSNDVLARQICCTHASQCSCNLCPSRTRASAPQKPTCTCRLLIDENGEISDHIQRVTVSVTNTISFYMTCNCTGRATRRVRSVIQRDAHHFATAPVYAPITHILGKHGLSEGTSAQTLVPNGNLKHCMPCSSSVQTGVPVAHLSPNICFASHRYQTFFETIAARCRHEYRDFLSKINHAIQHSDYKRSDSDNSMQTITHSNQLPHITLGPHCYSAVRPYSHWLGPAMDKKVLCIWERTNPTAGCRILNIIHFLMHTPNAHSSPAP